MGKPKRTSWTIDELRQDLARFEDELVEANLKPSTVETYVQRSNTFLRWLDGKYEPSGPASIPSINDLRLLPSSPAPMILFGLCRILDEILLRVRTVSRHVAT
jgi:hypothetical protein